MSMKGGKFNKPVHTRCRRCGRRAYHIRKKRCAACGYGAEKTLKKQFKNKEQRHLRR